MIYLVMQGEYSDREDAPSVDAVSVVRCKDCFYGKPDNETWWKPNIDAIWCEFRGTVEPNYFCADGKRG